jgi:hypothetical protein
MDMLKKIPQALTPQGENDATLGSTTTSNFLKRADAQTAETWKQIC